MSSLVVSGLALSMVLLSGAAIMVRSLLSLNRTDLGYGPEGIVSFEMSVPREPGGDPEAGVALFRRLEEELAAVPGVEAVARTNGMPLRETLGNTHYGWSREVLEQQTERGEVIISSPGYLEAMGARLLTGRYFTEEDQYGSTLPAIVDREVAERAWPGEDPIGKPIYFWRSAQEAFVVGVVEPMLLRDFGMRSFEAIHLTIPADAPQMGSTWVLRIRPGTPGLEASIRRAVARVDASLDPWRFRDLSQRVSQSKAPFRFVLFLMGVFATVAVVVAVVGLFGVIAYTVRTRAGEVGLRMALGAEGRAVLKMVLRQAAGMTVLGVAFGTGATLAMGRFLESIVFEVSPTDPGTLLVTALTLALVSILACAAPARWASRVAPAIALRGE
jgi:predicted permease